MHKLMNITKTVKGILEAYPSARDSDDELYARVCYETTGITAETSLYTAFMNRKAFGLPSYESVGRARRKLQEAFVELRPSKSALEAKNAEKEAYKAYAKVDANELG